MTGQFSLEESCFLGHVGNPANLPNLGEKSKQPHASTTLGIAVSLRSPAICQQLPKKC